MAKIRGADVAAYRDRRLSVGLPENLVRLELALLSNLFTVAAKEWRMESLTKSRIGATQKAGIEGLHFHDLRHEATSRLFEKGLNSMQVAAITGHKTLQMLKRYTHLRAEDLAKMLR